MLGAIAGRRVLAGLLGSMDSGTGLLVLPCARYQQVDGRRTSECRTGRRHRGPAPSGWRLRGDDPAERRPSGRRLVEAVRTPARSDARAAGAEGDDLRHDDRDPRAQRGADECQRQTRRTGVGRGKSGVQRRGVAAARTASTDSGRRARTGPGQPRRHGTSREHAVTTAQPRPIEPRDDEPAALADDKRHPSGRVRSGWRIPPVRLTARGQASTP
jgi:hypothetical protein